MYNINNSSFLIKILKKIFKRVFNYPMPYTK